MIRSLLAVLAALVALPPALACSLCSSQMLAPTFRQEAAQAKAILYGTVANPRLTGGGNGLTDLHLEITLRDHPILGNKTVLELPRYLPVSDPKDPPRFLVFCDVFNGKLDPYRGVPIKSKEVIDYVKGALALEARDRPRGLLYFFDYLENADPEIARDAFLEFAKATDQELAQVSGRLAAPKLRGWVKDSHTPPERLGLYAFLLGACGKDEDAPLLRSLLNDSSERSVAAFDGLLGGYVQLRPREGWDLAFRTLRDNDRPFPVRLAVVRALRVFHAWKPEEYREQIHHGLELVLARGDMADLAVEDVRRWQLWEMTPAVLALYGRKGYDSPIVRRAVLRYALTCPKPEAARLVAEVRRQDPEVVRDIEEFLQIEKAPVK